MMVRGGEERFSLRVRETKQNLVFFKSKKDNATANNRQQGLVGR